MIFFSIFVPWFIHLKKMAARPDVSWIDSSDDNDDDVRTVYVFGVCSGEGTSTARAGYAIDFGPDHERNRSGVPDGEQTTVRAELTAVLVALRSTLEGPDRSKRIVIKYKSPLLRHEIEAWAVAKKKEFGNEDLLMAIEIAKWNMVDFNPEAPVQRAWIEEAGPAEYFRFHVAALAARRIVGMHSTATAPYNDAFWRNGVPVVHIFGTATRSMRPKAGYGVWWAPYDPRNEGGLVEGEQDHRRGQLMAIWVAMFTALESGLDELIIRSKTYFLNRIMNNSPLLPCHGPPEHEDIFRKILALREKFSRFSFETAGDCPGQEKSQSLARELRRVWRTDVFTCGAPTDCTAVRYGVYFARGDARNESGRVSGEQDVRRAELIAVKRAIEVARQSGLIHVTIHSPSSQTVCFVNEGMRIHERSGWKGFNKQMVALGKKISALAAEMKLDALLCTSFEADACQTTACAIDPHFPIDYKTAFTSMADFGPKMMFRVFWENDGPHYAQGPVTGDRSFFRGRLAAIREALEMAAAAKISRLLIGTDCEFVLETMTEKVQWKGNRDMDFMNKDLLEAIDELENRFVNVEYELQQFPELDAPKRISQTSN